VDCVLNEKCNDCHLSLKDEEALAKGYLKNICPLRQPNSFDLERLFDSFQREVYSQGDCIWKQGDPSNSMKLLVRGVLKASLENEAGTSETVSSGNTIGELGLVEGIPRMSSVEVISSEGAVMYSLSWESFDKLLKEMPHAARLVDLICIRYLSTRVQHVSL
jgi:CRP-like cAMP-binding protein